MVKVLLHINAHVDGSSFTSGISRYTVLSILKRATYISSLVRFVFRSTIAQMDHSNPSVSLVASLSLQPDLGSSNLPASDPVEASEHLKELLVDFQKSHVTDPSMNGFVDSFKDLLGRVSFPRDYDSQESIPTQLALLEIASQCHNALEDFLRRERALGKRELWFEPAQGGNMHKAAIRSKTWKVNRVNSLVAVLTGHYASISLLWQLYEQSYLK